MSADHSQTEYKKYVNLLFDWHKLVLFFLLTGVTLGFAFYLNEPKIYESSASLMYQQQRINPTRLSPDDERRIEEMVNSVAEQVLSRTNLRSIIEEHDLYSDLRKNIPMEDVIERMREKDVSIRMGRQRGNVFSVYYRGQDPEKSMRVTNALSSRFIEENIRLREQRATETTRYIQDELRMSKRELEAQEQEMRDYKLRHYNEMPDQRAANMARLNSLQEQYQSTQSRIHDLEQTRLLVSEQIEIRRNLHRTQAGSVTAGDEPGSGELAAARRTLQEKLSRYTAEHPLVRRAQNRVEHLESERARLHAELEGDGALAEEGVENPVGVQGVRINELSVQLREIEMNLARLRSDAEETREKMRRYQEWIDAAPVREAEWSALTRGYEQLKRYHDDLLSESLAAEAAETLERRQQGSQFRVVDPAYLPKTPIKGSFLNILAVVAGAGGVAGAGLVIGLGMLDTSFRGVREVENYLDAPVVCALPLIVTRAEKRRKMAKNILWFLIFSVWAAAIVAATGYLYLIGEIFL